MPALLPEKTVNYKTYVKTALVEALHSVFNGHIDKHLQGTKVTIEFPVTKEEFPSVIVRFYERDIKNAGVGHEELIDEGVGARRFKHYLYDGDVEFAIYALSSYDRDLVSDTLVHTAAFADLEGYTNRFLERIYSPNSSEDPISLEHFINLDTDNLQGFGETQVPAPWQPEDVLVYQTSYRCSIFGEIYSLTPEGDLALVEQVDVYPWVEDIEEQPDPNPDDTGVWLP